MRAPSQLSGQRFGRLVAVQAVLASSGDSRWLCQCDCGADHVVAARHLKSGRTQSCGCLRRGAKPPEYIDHADARRGAVTKLYKVWVSMRQRCSNPANKSYPFHGARGVKFAQQWSSFAEFRRWAYDSGYQPGLIMQRLDTCGDYTPKNCRWSRSKNNSERASGRGPDRQRRAKRPPQRRDALGRFA